jgi:Winged helix DNA-binding domain
VAERVLTLRELNRSTLARQLLLYRARLPLSRAVERIAGLQAQWAPAPYVGLWTRLEGFGRHALERALQRQTVARGVLMRGTVHLVSARDYGLFATALDIAPPSWITPRSREVAARVRQPLRAFAAEPRTRAEIVEWLGREHGVETDETVGFWYALRLQARIAHAPESSLWRATQPLRFIAVEEERVDPKQARVELVRRYLAAFGPATRAQIANWSGIRVRDLRPALDALETLRRFRDEQGRELYDLPRAPIPPENARAPVRFLPKWDNALLDRRTLLPEEYRAAVLQTNADIEQTFLADGLVAGVWRFEGGRVVAEPFAPLPRAARRELEDEAGRLAEFLR